MLYTIVIQKGESKKEYNIYTDQLFRIGSVADSIKIENNKVYIVRKIQEIDGETTVRPTPTTEFIQDLKIDLFEGTNTIYIKDYMGTTITAEYLLKNDFTDTYPTRIEMESSIKTSAEGINLGVDKKLENYSTTEQMNSAINVSAEGINSEVSKKVNESELSTKISQNYEAVQVAWNTISEFIQFINARLEIKDNNGKLLTSLDKTGQHFFKENSNLLGDIGVKDGKIAFSINAKETGSGMVWGVTWDNKFMPVFQYVGYSSQGATDLRGKFQFASNVELGNHQLLLGQTESEPLVEAIVGENHVNLVNFKTFTVMDGLNPLIDMFVHASDGYTIQLSDINITGARNIFCRYLSSEIPLSESDIKLKKNVKQSNVNALDIINKIDHKSFDFKKDGEHVEIGYIAQELQKIAPFLTQEKDNTLMIKTNELLGVATKAIQEQQEKIDSLEKRIKKLERGF